MKFNFTDRVRRVLAMAREEAVRLRHDYTGTEHLLLGLNREREGVAAAVLAGFGVDPERLKERVEGSVRPGGSAIVLGDLRYTSQARRVLKYSMEAARELGHDHVDTEHLLLGLLREEKGIAATVLNRFDVTYERAIQETARILGQRPPSRSGASRGGGWLRRLLGSGPDEAPDCAPLAIVIDDASTASIYEQIVAQVREAVATGRVRPGERLPTVRRLADELDIAPGTVARAYGELERLGVVVTEGARGTRVAEQPKESLPASERGETLVGLMRPVVVAAFHLGATADELGEALQQAMRGIYPTDDEADPA